MPCNSDASTPRQVQGLWVGCCLLALEILLWLVCERKDSKLTLPQGQTHFWAPIVAAVFWSTVKKAADSLQLVSPLMPNLPCSHSRVQVTYWDAGGCFCVAFRLERLALLPTSCCAGVLTLWAQIPAPDTCLALSLLHAGAAHGPRSVVTHALFWNHEWFSALKQGYLHWLKIKEGHISKFKTCKIY